MFECMSFALCCVQGLYHPPLAAGRTELHNRDKHLVTRCAAAVTYIRLRLAAAGHTCSVYVSILHQLEDANTRLLCRTRPVRPVGVSIICVLSAVGRYDKATRWSEPRWEIPELMATAFLPAGTTEHCLPCAYMWTGMTRRQGDLSRVGRRCGVV